MSQRSKDKKSFEEWKAKAMDRGNKERALRKENKRLRKDRDKYKEEAKAANAELTKRSHQAVAHIEKKRIWSS